MEIKYEKLKINFPVNNFPSSLFLPLKTGKRKIKKNIHKM